MERRQVQINSIQSKQVETQYGIKTIYNIVAGDGLTYSAYAGKWNQDWKQGDIVEAIYNKYEKGDRTYHQLKAPPEFKQSFGGGGGNQAPSAWTSDAVSTVINELANIKKELSAIKLAVQAKEIKKNELPNFNDSKEPLPF